VRQDVSVATYVAFLRAINLGARRKFPKASIIKAVGAAGFGDVETYINTGNVRFSTTMRSRAKIEAALEAAFEAEAGFEVPTIVLSVQELSQVAAEADRLAASHDGQHYVSLLKDKPTAARTRAVQDACVEPERCEVGDRAAHLLLGADYHTAKLSNATVEKHLGVATNRNVKVIRTLAEKWGS
jgi:uncharacterized protein (DUF1697 family)